MQVASVALVWPSLALIFAVIFIGLWRVDRVRQYLLGFAAGFFALAVAMTFHIAFPDWNTPASIALAHGLSCFSIGAIIWGATDRLGQTPPFAAMAAVTLGSCGLLWAALDADKNDVALLAQNGSSGLLFGIGALTLWLCRPADLFDRILVWTMAAIATLGVVRPAILLLTDAPIADIVHRKVDFDALSLIALTVLTVILGLCLVAITIREALDVRQSQTRIDQASGFHNRQTFDDLCRASVSKAARLSLPVSMAVFEIDRLDALKEHWGPDVTGMVLHDIAGSLRASQREGDIVGRVGEAQFAVLLVGVGSASALKLTRAFRAAVDENYREMRTRTLKMTLSCGIVEGRRGERYDSVAARAFGSLELAKKAGTNSVVMNGREVEYSEIDKLASGPLTSFG